MFLLDQRQQRIRQVATCVDLPGTESCCYIGKPPRMPFTPYRRATSWGEAASGAVRTNSRLYGAGGLKKV